MALNGNRVLDPENQVSSIEEENDDDVCKGEGFVKKENKCIPIITLMPEFCKNATLNYSCIECAIGFKVNNGKCDIDESLLTKDKLYDLLNNNNTNLDEMLFTLTYLLNKRFGIKF